MSDCTIIKNKAEFETTAETFLDKIFNPVLKNNLGDIEIRTFPKGQRPGQYFCQTAKEASEIAFNLCNSGIDVYFGVNPRVGKSGKKENVHYVTAFHAEVDYGAAGHKKKPDFENYDEAIKAITNFNPQPTLINLSGGGLHCYWMLSAPVKTDEIGVDELESVNKYFLRQLGGDKGTHNLDRILRIPGTYNLKLPDNPRKVRVVQKDGPVYDLDDFKTFINTEEPKPKDTNDRKKSDPIKNESSSTWDGDIDKLAVSDRINDLIKNGNDGTYSSRSEADQAVITALVHKGVGESDIKAIFSNFKIGEKYREHSAPDDYLKYNIKKAEEFSNLTEEERQDPLFISRSLHKTDNGKYQLKIVPFQEYMNKKHRLKFLEKERTFFRYSGKCYEQCSEDRLNNLCQTELGKHRDLFPPASKANFIHFAIGNDMVDDDKAFEDQIRYLTMQNGLYDLSQHELIEHNPSIFTTNLLPYDHDPAAVCPRWLQYLDEVFISDAETIKFVQEAVGYAFHKSIPKAVLFFIIGDGGNGKSVFIDVISSLCGKENVCNISLNKLNDEKYLPELFGKMINVSGETPNKKCMNTDLVKAVVAGDWVTGREVYKKPSKFKPYAKHYLGMNTLPDIEDNTHGMWRRIHVIEFPRKFAEHEMDVELTEKLMAELSGIFNWALEGYKRLDGQKFIFSESRQCANLKNNISNRATMFWILLIAVLKIPIRKTLPHLKTCMIVIRDFVQLKEIRSVFPKKSFGLF